MRTRQRSASQRRSSPAVFSTRWRPSSWCRFSRTRTGSPSRLRGRCGAPRHDHRDRQCGHGKEERGLKLDDWSASCHCRPFPPTCSSSMRPPSSSSGIEGTSTSRSSAPAATFPSLPSTSTSRWGSSPCSAICAIGDTASRSSIFRRVFIRYPELDLEELLDALDVQVVGIDLHWMVHVQGSLAVAERIKRRRPDILTLFGGISSTYYAKELVRYPFIDMVMRGYDTLEPMRSLLDELKRSRSFQAIPNLMWKDGDGESERTTSRTCRIPSAAARIGRACRSARTR